MKLLIFGAAIVLFFASCNTGSNAEKQYADGKGGVYKLKLSPPGRSRYYFTISNKTEMEMEVNNDKITNTNKSDVGLYYEIRPDSAGNFLLTMTYDKLHLYSKNGETESEMDADNAAGSPDPVERMLGALKNASIHAVLNPHGEIKSIAGFQEIGDKIIQGFDPDNVNEKEIAKKKWNDMAGDGIIKKNIDDIFRIFPDSSVHVGDKWHINTKQPGQIPMNLKSYYTLEKISDNIATIKLSGEIMSDSAAGTQFQASAILKGTQEGDYQADISTGIIMKGAMSASLEGSVETMGREIPVKIEIHVKISGKKQ